MIKALPLRDGFDETLLPGERGGRIEAARRATGIPIRAATWEALGALAKKLAIDLARALPPRD